MQIAAFMDNATMVYPACPIDEKVVPVLGVADGEEILGIFDPIKLQGKMPTGVKALTEVV
jgi:hypothetical protein